MSERITAAELSRIRQRVDAATPGPWVAETYPLLQIAQDDGGFQWCVDESKMPENPTMVEAIVYADPFRGRAVGRVDRVSEGSTTGLPGCVEVSAVDAVFIAHARKDVPRLLDEIERLTSLLERYRSESTS